MKSYDIPSNLLGSKSSEIRRWAISSKKPSERPGHFRHLRKEADVVWVRELLLGMADGGFHEPTRTGWWCNNHLEKYESQLG